MLIIPFFKYIKSNGILFITLLSPNFKGKKTKLLYKLQFEQIIQNIKKSIFFSVLQS